MTEITDEMLMAYADGQASPADRATIETALARDQTLRPRIEAFLRTGAPLQAVFDPVLAARMPERLLRTVRETPMAGLRQAEVTPQKAGILGWLAARLKSGDEFGSSGNLVMAGLTALVVAGSGLAVLEFGKRHAGEGLRPPGLLASTSRGALAAGDFAKGLETTASGETLKVVAKSGAAWTFESDFSFKTRDGGYCRQYALSYQDSAGRYAGVACRDDAGAWWLVVHERADGAGSKGQATRPAAGPTGELAERLKAAIDERIEGDVLVGKDETDVIRSGWSKLSKSKNT